MKEPNNIDHKKDLFYNILNDSLYYTEKDREIIPTALYLSFIFPLTAKLNQIDLYTESNQTPDHIAKFEDSLFGIEISDIVSNTYLEQNNYEKRNPISIKNWNGLAFDITKHFTHNCPKKVNKKNKDQFILYETNMQGDYSDEISISSLANTGLDKFMEIVLEKTKKLALYQSEVKKKTLVLTWRWKVAVSHQYLDVPNQIKWILNYHLPNKTNYWGNKVAFGVIIIIEKIYGGETLLHCFRENQYFCIKVPFCTGVPSYRDSDWTPRREILAL